jgi:hypothetical protein
MVRVGGRLLAGNVVSNPVETLTFLSCESCVLSGGGLCHQSSIAHCVCVCVVERDQVQQ